MEPDFIDLHAAIISRLQGKFGTVRVSSKIPNDLTTPAVVVMDAGGTDDGFNETAYFDVQTFAPNRDAAWALASTARKEMQALSGTDLSKDGRELFDRVQTTRRPSRVSYSNPDVTRYVGTYAVTVRVQ